MPLHLWSFGESGAGGGGQMGAGDVVGLGWGQEGRSLIPRDRSHYVFRHWDSEEENIATFDW